LQYFTYHPVYIFSEADKIYFEFNAWKEYLEVCEINFSSFWKNFKFNIGYTKKGDVK
jgi:hypothetical protein